MFFDLDCPFVAGKAVDHRQGVGQHQGRQQEHDTAAILRDSLIFLSFSDREGGPLPPKEALACGCVVIGYHGNSGTEYFDEDFCYPVTSTDTITFSRTVEAVINQYLENSTSFREKAKRGSEYVTSKYSIEREEADIIRFWKSIFANEPFPFH